MLLSGLQRYYLSPHTLNTPRDAAVRFTKVLLLPTHSVHLIGCCCWVYSGTSSPHTPRTPRGMLLSGLQRYLSPDTLYPPVQADHCPMPDGGHLPHAARRFQCCDAFGRQTGRAVEGCNTPNAARTVSGHYAPVLLTKMANWKEGGSVSSSANQDMVFFKRLDQYV